MAEPSVVRRIGVGAIYCAILGAIFGGMGAYIRRTVIGIIGAISGFMGGILVDTQIDLSFSGYGVILGPFIGVFTVIFIGNISVASITTSLGIGKAVNYPRYCSSGIHHPFCSTLHPGTMVLFA